MFIVKWAALWQQFTLHAHLLVSCFVGWQRDHSALALTFQSIPHYYLTTRPANPFANSFVLLDGFGRIGFRLIVL